MPLISWEDMQEVNVGIVGLGNVGSSTLAILSENGDQIALKLGLPPEGGRRVQPLGAHQTDSRGTRATSSRPRTGARWWRTRTCRSSPNWWAAPPWRREIVNAAIANRKSVVTANKELMAACGPEIWDRAIQAGINLAMEASVCGGIPIHAVLREGISGDRVQALYGILNGTCNYILTEIEKRGAAMETMIAEAQRLGYAEADPSADVDGYDARSKLVLLAALAFGEKITPSDIFVEGIRRITPLDFQYAQDAEAHHPPDLRRAQDAGRADSVRAPGADSHVDDSGRRAGPVQRGVGEGHVRRGHLLLRLGRGASHRRRRGQRPDARGARDPRRQSGARLAVRARAAGREQAGLGEAAEARVLPALPRGGPARASSPNWRAFWPASTSAWKRCCRSPATPSTICRS